MMIVGLDRSWLRRGAYLGVGFVRHEAENGDRCESGAPLGSGV
jgi:hypothetical protein